PYAPRRVITQLHDIALLVLSDPHQYLPSYLLFCCAPFTKHCIRRGDTSQGDASGISIPAVPRKPSLPSTNRFFATLLPHLRQNIQQLHSEGANSRRNVCAELTFAPCSPTRRPVPIC